MSQDLLDCLVATKILTAYERDYELDKLSWYYDEMGGGVEAKRKKVLGSAPTRGVHYHPCVIPTGDTQDPSHTSLGVFVSNHLLDKTFMIQRYVLVVCVLIMSVSSVHACVHVAM